MLGINGRSRNGTFIYFVAWIATDNSCAVRSKAQGQSPRTFLGIFIVSSNYADPSFYSDGSSIFRRYLKFNRKGHICSAGKEASHAIYNSFDLPYFELCLGCRVRGDPVRVRRYGVYVLGDYADVDRLYTRYRANSLFGVSKKAYRKH